MRYTMRLNTYTKYYTHTYTYMYAYMYIHTLAYLVLRVQTPQPNSVQPLSGAASVL